MFVFRLVASRGLVDDGGERLGEGRMWLLVLGDFEPGVERLVRESSVAVVGVCVGAVVSGLIAPATGSASSRTNACPSLRANSRSSAAATPAWTASASRASPDPSEEWPSRNATVFPRM